MIASSTETPNNHSCLTSQSPDDDVWIFGYGSLVWKADFPYEEKRTGYIKGFHRRFFQHSIDHRGTADKPGRVVTLIHSDDRESKVWGMAYRIATTKREEVLQHLDYREKNGYERCRVQFHPYPWSDRQTNDPLTILLYLATQNNPSFAGDSDDLETIAKQVIGATGQSGKNPEYVYKLADAMRHHYPGVTDDHLFDLERILLEHDRTEDKRVKYEHTMEAMDLHRSATSKEG